MLDLNTLFSSQKPIAAVPNRAQENASASTSISATKGDDARPTVPIHQTTGKPPEILVLTGIRPNLQHHAGGEAGHSGHNGNTSVFGQVCPPKPLQHKALDELGTLGTLGTVDLQGGEDQEGDGAPVGGAAREQFALHPAAVILALAYCRKVKADNDETVSSLLHLETMPPGEQVQRWHSSCLEVGLKPWEVLTLPAPQSGHDCTRCKHLTTQQLSNDGGRRQFHWACGLGFLILETGRATERIWIAPPECSSWERWYPSKQR